MMTRRFRAFAEQEDLQRIFRFFQNLQEIYYVPTYSDAGVNEISDITGIPDLGINFHGSHIGNRQFRVFPKTVQCRWEEYQCRKEKDTSVTRFTTLCDGNTELIDIDLGGVYQGIALFPTTISTLYYDTENAKRLFDELRKIFRRESVKTVNGYFLCEKAYADREKYRFCTISIGSPPEYDLIIE